MADPFSIIAGAGGLIDISNDFITLQAEVETLGDVSKSIRSVFDRQRALCSPDHENPQLRDLWSRAGETLVCCTTTLVELEQYAATIVGQDGPTVKHSLDALKKTVRKRSKDPDLRQCRERLHRYQLLLSLAFHMINSHIGHTNHDTLQALSHDVRKLLEETSVPHEKLPQGTGQDSQHQLINLLTMKLLRDTVEPIQSPPSTFVNQHFRVPQPVSSIFTGRKDRLDELSRTFIGSTVYTAQQKRFVIYGMGGSGKTQFCSKFAEQNRDRFWGVFCINARSEELIKQSYSLIATIAGVEPNEKAAIYWLVNIQFPWLLIIDNADDPSMTLENHFPPGNRGHILVTTRNPRFKVHGNVGSRSFDFGGLAIDEAKELLLRAAEQPEPWDVDTFSLASNISKTLGHLALAIRGAGAAISSGICTLRDYLILHRNYWQFKRRPTKSMNTARNYEVFWEVYTTLDICYRHIESKQTEAARDAIELLHTFAFLHGDSIRFDILKRAMNNSKFEAEQQLRMAADQKKEGAQVQTSMVERIKAMADIVRLFIIMPQDPPVYPTVIRQAINAEDKDQFILRVRVALKELVEMSLICHDQVNDNYSMHPVVHEWARERGAETFSEQALRCEAAGMMISASILLPPLQNTSTESRYARELLPHLDSLKTYEIAIKEFLERNRSRGRTWSSWFQSKINMSPHRSLMKAKFSFVYMSCGRYDDARSLQIQVRDYTLKLLGPNHEKTRRISLALSETYRHLDRPKEAATLQKSVLNSCLHSFGSWHPETLRAKDSYSKILWQQGFMTDAKTMQLDVVKGFKKYLEPGHKDTLKATHNLALFVSAFWDHQDLKQAYELATEAVVGMQSSCQIEQDDDDLLFAQETRAQIGLRISQEYYAESLDTMLQILAKRTSKHGRGHPYTLLAMVHTARAHSAIGHHEAAETLVVAGLDMAERNLSKDHIGTLFGRQFLGMLMIRQHRYVEAEAILLDVSMRQKKTPSLRIRSYHPDRLGTLIELSKCYFYQQKFMDSVLACDDALVGFEDISVKEHVLAKETKDMRHRCIELQKRKLADEDLSSIIKDAEAHPQIDYRSIWFQPRPHV
ncbi:hypothetical protein EJ05DRAFT_528924 [Pseudovirgaria hyperparasitica]|uniref:NB-ARC domain-containing protein n=1 Tax=Pseudovirgaria hyperparasitica TaxID=470096 RepID=A0A6A6W3X3_9PEZI|nr:uncharacterized protein EJ05DRAFT_528924 [Pseudovirgaria hyperparasitica]KAF2757313.1 hypothetical protein EJ05DRAFT_528924 [Pseudovirgaria hyperparasitica]